MPIVPFNIKCFLFVLIVLSVFGCDRYTGGDFNPAQLEPLPGAALDRYADTSLILTHLATFDNPSQQVDSLLHYAEWLKNYRDDGISLFYAQRAYDIATENKWNIPRAFSANRLAWSKGKKALFGEDLEDAMVDARISRRLLTNHHDPYWEADMNNLFGFLFMKTGQLDSARIYLNKALKSAPNLASDPDLVEWNRAMILHNLATTYTSEDPEQELDYYLQSDSVFQQIRDVRNRPRLWLDLANYYIMTIWAPDYADSLLQTCILYGKENNDFELVGKSYQDRGNLYKQKFNNFEKLEDFDKAITFLNESLSLSLENGYLTYLYLGNCFQDSWAIDIDESHADSAIHYYQLALEHASKEGSISVMRDISQNLFTLYSFNEYQHKNALEGTIDTVLDNNYRAVVDTITTNARLAYKRINEVEQRDLRLSATQKRQQQQLIGLAILLALGGLFIFFMQRLQNRRLRAEMAALRAQINPHFMSNSLNAIDNLVNKGESRAASKYLVHFSRLTRQVLNGSAKSITHLEQELKTLKHFLALEQLRFSDKLSYEIQTSEEVDEDRVLIPTMILQPYVENAIWHGIKPKTEGGHISIKVFKESDQILRCVIEDNGVGRAEAARRKAASLIKQKSMGMEITKDRLRSLGRVSGKALEIEDLYAPNGEAAGTKVILRFPYKVR